MADPSASVVHDPATVAAELWHTLDATGLDQGVPYPPEMAAAPTSTPNVRRKSRRSWFETTPGPKLEIAVEKKVRRKSARQSGEIETLLLTHFTNAPRIDFGKIRPKQSKTRILVIKNPHDYEQKVRVEKVPVKKMFSVDEKDFIVEGNSTFTLTVSWSPDTPGNVREMLLFHIDSSYRLQAYVFGTVEEPPQKKKKLRRGGLLSKKVSRPLSVIQTAGLANINRSYSPDKQLGIQTKNSKKLVERRRSPRFIKPSPVSAVAEQENVCPQRQDSREKGKSGGEQALGNTEVRVEAPTNRRKMRRSDTYSNVSGVGLPVPVINGETVEGLVSTPVASGESLKGPSPACLVVSGGTNAEQLPTPIRNEGAMVEPAGLLNEHCTPAGLSLLQTEDGGAVQDTERKVAPALEQSLIQDSLIQTPETTAGRVELPSFLSPNTFLENSQLDILRQSSKKKHPDVSPIQFAHLKEDSICGGLNISPNSFLQDMNAVKKRLPSYPGESPDRQPSPDTVLNDSIPHDIMMRQLRSIQTNIHEKSFERVFTPSPGNAKKMVRLPTKGANSRPGAGVKGVFQQKRTSPRLRQHHATSVEKSESNTFVSEPKKARILEQKAPATSSPRRTTFTVLKEGSATHKTKPRATRGRKLGRPGNAENELPVPGQSPSQLAGLSEAGEAERSELVTDVNDVKLSSASPEPAVPTAARTITKDKPSVVGVDSGASSKQLFPSGTADESLESVFNSPVQIAQHSEAQMLSNRASLTVTKICPSAALMDCAQKPKSGTCLFQQASSKSPERPSCITPLQRQGNIKEEALEQSVGKNSTFDTSSQNNVCSSDSYTVEKSNVSTNSSFPTTPHQLPSSPNPDHSRRSTHVVADPKVLNPSQVDRRKLFPALILDDETDPVQEGHAAVVEDGDQVTSQLEAGGEQDGVHLSQCDVSMDSSMSRDSLTAFSEKDSLTAISEKDSLTAISEKDSLTDISEKETPDLETCNLNADSDRVGLNRQDSDEKEASVSNSGLQREVCVTASRQSPSIATEDEKDAGTAVNHVTEAKTSNDQLFFVPLEKTRRGRVASQPVERVGPHPFLKRSTSTVTEKAQLKRKKSDSIPTTGVPPVRQVVTRHMSQTTHATRQMTSKTVGEPGKLERQLSKPKPSARGVPQSKLILLKKSRTALPKHPLPFAAKNMYYDERWMEKQERGFVNWLNFILTPAEEYQSSDVKVKVDAGKLTLDVAKGKTKLAPTNEVLSFRTYAARRKLNRLRRSACKLFQSETVIKVIQKLEHEVECERLIVRKDRMLHADLGAKQKILDTLLSYNPLWLRMGLETIFGEVIPLQSNSDVIGLSRFILTRLLGNPDIASEYAHPTVPHLYGDGYGKALAQHTLKKFLLLVYFLDQAKAARLIDHNPCLFCKDADFKASKSLLVQFSKDYLSGEGDITRHLGYLGCKVSYTQTARDEFYFAVKNLATDLRDGVRLTRVLEFLCQKPELSDTMRVPAISRLQKIHNMDVVFRTLSQHTVQTDGIGTRDIVDGHRERTLKLLWSIILQFQVEMLLNSEQLKEEIALLQRSLKVRSHLQNLVSLEHDVNPRRESAEPDLHTQNSHLNLLLKWCRCVCAFYNVKVENFTVSFSDGRALCYLVHHYHPALLPLTAVKAETTSTQLEQMEKRAHQEAELSLNDSCCSSPAIFPDMEDPVLFEKLSNNEKDNFKLLYDKVKELGGVPLMLKWSDMSSTIPDEKVVATYLLYLCARLLDIRHESRAARVIQLAWRSYRLRKELALYDVKLSAASTIQRAVRRYLACLHERRQAASAVCIQRVWRGCRARKQVKLLKVTRLLEQHAGAAVVIQQAVRGFLAKRRYTKMKHCVVKLQACVRGYLFRKRIASTATVIQKWVRGHQQRSRFLLLKRSAVKIQSRWRGFRSRSHYQGQKLAASTLQTALRAYLQKRAAQREYQKVRAACIAIQGAWRVHKQRSNFLQLKRSAVNIQSQWRGFRSRQQYLRQKSAATTIQTALRAHLQKRAAQRKYKQVRAACIAIQRAWRGHQQRSNFLQLKRSAVKIQSQWRGFRSRRQYLRQTSAATTLQTAFRAHLQKRAAQREYQRVRAACITIQRTWRGYQLARLAVQDTAAVRIQAAVRGLIARRKFLTLKKAATVIQATVRGQRQRMCYQQTRQAAVCIQQFYRGYQLTKQHVAGYQRSRTAAKLVQAWWRMTVQRRQYLQTVAAVVTIQACFRGYQTRCRLGRQQAAAGVVQRWYRNCRKTQQCQQQYRSLKAAAVTFQAVYRGWLARKELKRHKAARRIQAGYRGYRARREYLHQRQCIIALQASVRMVQARQRYRATVQAVLTIQRRLRARLAGAAGRHKFLVRKGAAMTIQAGYRGYLVRKYHRSLARAVVRMQARVRGKLQRSRFQALCRAVRVCQGRFRAQLAGREERARYQKMRQAAVVIQSVMRRHSCRSQYLRTREAVVKIQAAILGYLTRQRFLAKKRATEVIQTRWRAELTCRRQQEQFRCQKKASLVLQCAFRRWRCQSDYLRTRQAILTIQANVKCYLARREFLAKKQAVLSIQRRWRAELMCRQQQERYLRQRNAAVVLQSAFRRWQCETQYHKVRHAVITLQATVRQYLARKNFLLKKQAGGTIQRRWRAELLCRQEQQKFFQCRIAAVWIQRAWRMVRARRHYCAVKNAAIAIQANVRGHQARQKYVKLRHAATVVQTQWRATLLARRQRQAYTHLQRSAVLVQSVWRMYRERRNFRNTRTAAIRVQSAVRTWRIRRDFLRRRAATEKLQGWFRRCRETRVLHTNFLIQRGAAMTIQASFRGYQQRKLFQQQKRSCIAIQTLVRSFLARRRYRQMRKENTSAICIQQHWRACVLGRQVRAEYLRRKQAIIRIQQAYRALQVMKTSRQNFQRLKAAATFLQACRRGKIARKELTRRRAARTIQACYRGYSTRRKFQKTRNSVILLQSVVRMWQTRQQYRRLRSAALIIQNYVRATIEARKCRNEFLLWKRAVLTIQAAFRGYRERKHRELLVSSATKIQAYIRGHLQRGRFERLRKAAVVCQQRYRAKVLGDFERKCLAEQTSAAILIQSHVRGWIGRQRFLLQKRLQRVVKVARLHLSVVRIQRTWRKYEALKLARERLHSVLVIQYWIRSKLMRIQYLRNREKICRLQAVIRTWLLRRQKAAMVIQTAAKKWLEKRREARRMKSVTFIQALWRGYCVRKKIRSKKMLAVRKRAEKATASVTEEKKLGNRVSSALDFLLHCKQLSQIVGAVMHLEVATRLSSVCCERVVAVNALSVLYKLLNSCNRSLPHMELIRNIICVLLNLAKYEKTRPAVFEEQDGIATLVELMQIYREKGEIFLKTCTLLGVLAMNSACKQAILADKKILEKLKSIQILTARKHKLEENQRITRAKMNATFNVSVLRSPVKKHRVKPDWLLHKDRLGDFENPLKAINFVHASLGLK